MICRVRRMRGRCERVWLRRRRLKGIIVSEGLGAYEILGESWVRKLRGELADGVHSAESLVATRFDD